jgi:type IV pilus assembly protein PilE
MNKKAFTLIELLVAVLIIGILAAIALPQYRKAVEKTRWMEGVIAINALADAWERHRLITGDYTNNLNDLDITVPAGKAFTGRKIDLIPIPHIQMMRAGNNNLWLTKYANTAATFCTALNTYTAGQEFCKQLTGDAGAPCPEHSFTCYTIRR